MEAERKLQKAKIALMRNKNFALLQGVMMIGKTSVDDKTPTARTNGRDEIYGREFVTKLRDPELCFVIAHEAGHKMYRHMTTWKKLHDEDHRLANIACDHVINLMLKELDPSGTVITMPVYTDGPHKGKQMGMCDTRFKGMHSKQVFDILKEEKEEGGGGNGDGPGGPCDGPGGGGSGGIDEHDWDGANDMTDEEKRELVRDIDQAIRQGLMAHNKQVGEGAGGLDRVAGVA